MWVVTITPKPKEFHYIFFLETRFFTTNESASFSDIERIGNHQRPLYFVRHISSRRASSNRSRFKFERNRRYLFIQIKKMAKEGRCSLHWLRGCSTCMYRSMFEYKNIITFQIYPVDKTTFPHFLTKTTLLMMISEFRSTKFHKNIIYENLVS